MAPFENVVVEACVLALEVVVVFEATVSVAVVVFAAAVVSVVETPAAESTQSFMLVIDIRVMLSERALVAATTAGLVESTAAFVGLGTNVVN
jgi:hypothetical protein